MTDKEIGELWRSYRIAIRDYPLQVSDDILKVIRKLVEERARSKWLDHGGKLAWDDVAASYRWNALHDFGIDKKDWEKEK